MSEPQAFDVTVTRTVQIIAADAFEAGQRGLDWMQRQKAYPGSLTVTVALSTIEREADDED